jgi:hypothetical protein
MVVPEEQLAVDLVGEGGGVKGIGLAGASLPSSSGTNLRRGILTRRRVRRLATAMSSAEHQTDMKGQRHEDEARKALRRSFRLVPEAAEEAGA